MYHFIPNVKVDIHQFTCKFDLCSNNSSPFFLVYGVFCALNLETQQGQRSSHPSIEFILETSGIKIFMLQSSIK